MPGRMLVCDDKRYVVRLLEVNLRRMGWNVTPAFDGVSALAQILEDNPDAVILGSGMPDMSGQEITRLIRRNSRTGQIFVLLMLDQADPELITEGYQAGADMVVTKPFDVRQLSTLFPHGEA